MLSNALVEKNGVDSISWRIANWTSGGDRAYAAARSDQVEEPPPELRPICGAFSHDGPFLRKNESVHATWSTPIFVIWSCGLAAPVVGQVFDAKPRTVPREALLDSSQRYVANDFKKGYSGRLRGEVGPVI